MQNYRIYKHLIDIISIFYCCTETYRGIILHTPFILILQSILDIPFTTTSFYIHHVVSIIFTMNYILANNSESSHDTMLQVYRTNYSNLALLLYRFLQEFKEITPHIHIIIKTICIIAFFYYNTVEFFFIVSNNNGGLIQTICLNVFYGLNLYWLSKILRNIMRDLRYYYTWQMYDTHIYGQYIYIAIPILNILSFPDSMNLLHFIDIYVVTIYSIVCHIYHKNYYESYISRIQIEPNYYFYEKIALQLRSIVGLVNICVFKYVELDYFIIPLSLMIHGQIAYLFHLDYYNNSNSRVFKYQKLIFKLPLCYDIICCYVFADAYIRTMFCSMLFLALFCSYNNVFGKTNNHFILIPFMINYLIVSQYK